VVELAYGSAPAPTGISARAIAAIAPAAPSARAGREHGWEGALGADLAVRLSRDVRVGPWIELRTSSDPLVGGELQLTGVPRTLDMFWYQGRGVLALRAGRDGDLATAAVAYGYQAPWDLLRPRHGRPRYMIGVRVVASATRALADPRVWSATVGLETEPVGALRYLLGIRSWY
jgi:hypothetical protein